MQLSPLYLEQLEAAHLDGEQLGEFNGRRDLVVRQLDRQIRGMPVEVVARVRSLSTEQLDLLGEALLDFESMSDLLTWLQGNAV